MTRSLAALVLALLLAGCASFPPNPPLAKYEPKAGYRFDKLELGRHNTVKLFVIVTLSGGGTRAAALAYGVMEELRATPIGRPGEGARLLDEVDVISSVSGGTSRRRITRCAARSCSMSSRTCSSTGRSRASW